MHSQGLLKDDEIYAELGELILGRKPGRESDSERIHFAHMGMGIADVALGFSVYQRAMEKKIGERRTLWKEPLWA
jgi:ornithine cyclodeaminase